MLCPNSIPYSIEAFFYLLRAVLGALSCSTGSLCQNCFASFFTALCTVHPLWLFSLPCELEEHAGCFSPCCFPFNLCLLHESQERSAAAWLGWGDAVLGRVLQGWPTAAEQAWSLFLFAQGGSSQPRGGLGHGAFCHVWFFFFKTFLKNWGWIYFYVP